MITMVTLPRGARRHRHRHPARRRAHLAARPRRCCSPRSTTSSGRADMNAPMANLPVVIFQFAMSPYDDWQRLAWGGAALITLLRARHQHRGARDALPPENARLDEHMNRPDRMPTRVPSASSRTPSCRVRDLDFYYGKFHALKNVNLDIAGEAGHRVHRPVGLRQVDAAAHASTACTSCIPGSAPRARSRSTARTSSTPGATSPCSARRSAWCSRSPRRSRCRSTTTSPSACACTSTCRSAQMDERVEWALTKAALWDEVKDKLQAERARPLRRPAAAPVHRARHRGQARGAAARRAALGARPDLDRQDRGADRRAQERLHDRDRHPQHAAGGARAPTTPRTCTSAS